MNFGYYKKGQVSAAREEELKSKLQNIVDTERFVFCDEKAGSHSQEQYHLLQRLLRPGDSLYLDRLDSLGSHYKQIAKEWRRITEKIGADIIVLDGERYLDSRKMRLAESNGFTQQGFLFLLEYLHEMPRSRVREIRQNSVKPEPKGPKKNGRPQLEIDEHLLEETALRWIEREITAAEASEIMGWTRSSWYKYTKERGYTLKPAISDTDE